MSLYSTVVYLHIVGALALFATLGLEWAAGLRLRRVSTAAQAGEWTTLLRALRRLEPPAALLLLATGLYLAVRHWGYQPWIGLGMLGFAINGLLGGALGRRLAALERAAAEAEAGDPPDADRLRRLADPALRLCTWLRTTIGLAIVFMMSAKPSLPLCCAAFAGAVAIGLAFGLPAWLRERRASPIGAPSAGG